MRVPPGSQLVFQQSLNATAPSSLFPIGYSDSRFNEWLGQANDLALFAVADRVVGPIVNFGVLVLEGTDDEVPWFSLGALNISKTVTAGDVTVAAGADTDAFRFGRPCLGLRRLQVNLGSDGTGSARIRVWAAGRNGYGKFHRLLFADRVEGLSPLYTPETCAWLATADRLAVAAVVEEVTGSSPTLTVQMEESPNGRAWRNVNASPELDNIDISPITIFPLPFGVSDAVPLAGFIRFRVQLSGTNPGARVRLWVTGRDVRAG